MSGFSSIRPKILRCAGSLSKPSSRSGAERWKKLNAWLCTNCAQWISSRSFTAAGGGATAMIASDRVAGEAQQQVRRGEMEKAQRVALHELRAVDQLAQFYRRGRRGHGHDRVARRSEERRV